MYTFDNKYAAHVIGQNGQEFAGLVPDQIANAQKEYWQNEWTFPAHVGDGFIVAQIDGEATGLGTPGIGDLVVRDVTEHDPEGNITTAQLISQLVRGNLKWDTNDSVSGLEELAELMDAETVYGKIIVDEDGKHRVVPTWSGDHLADDPVWLVFPDGSKIIIAGEVWSIEDGEPFSLAGKE